MATLRWSAIAFVLLLLAGSLCPAAATVRLGGVNVGAGYGYYPGPFWPGFYSPVFYDGWGAYPFYAPVVFVQQSDTGQVNLQSSYRDAEVYLDDAYAGTTSSLKKFWLAPGVYQLEVRPKGHAPQTKRIYVLTGKTLKVSLE